MRRPSAAIVALIVLALVDVGLVWMAVRSTRADATHQTPSTVAAASPEGPSQDGSSSSTSDAAPGSSKSADAQLVKVIVAALSHDRAWRAVTTSMTCTKDAKKATIGHTEDAGDTWTRVKVPMLTVSGLTFDSGKMIATGLDSSCKPVAYALSSSADPEQVSDPDVWSVGATDSSTLVVAGHKVLKQPCSGRVLDVAANSDSQATVLCQDGAIERSTDKGASWDDRGTVKHAVAIGTASSGETVYVVARTDCGLSVDRLTPGSKVTAPCVEGTKDLTGPVDATIVGDTLWLLSDDDVVTTSVSGLSEHGSE